MRKRRERLSVQFYHLHTAASGHELGHALGCIPYKSSQSTFLIGHIELNVVQSGVCLGEKDYTQHAKNYV